MMFCFVMMDSPPKDTVDTLCLNMWLHWQFKTSLEIEIMSKTLLASWEGIAGWRESGGDIH
jgi:hypothetical protein